MQAHLPRRVHENVAAQLVDVAGGASQPMTARDQSSVRPPGRGPPDGRAPPACHAIGAVEDALPVNQQGPRETGLAHVVFGTLPSLERHDYDAETQVVELTLPLSQLRHVLPTGESAEMSMKDHQEPVAPVVLESMNEARSILQGKFDGRPSDWHRHLIPAADTLPPRT